jgi:tetratricopeptide (TPR) repeat protein
LLFATALLVVPAQLKPAVACTAALLLAPAAANLICTIGIILLLIKPKHTVLLMDIGEFTAQFAITIDSLLAVVPFNPFAFGRADHLYNLSIMLAYRQNNKEATKVIQQLIELVEKEEGENSIALVEPLGLLIGSLRHEGKFDECIACGDRLMKIASDASGRDKVSVAGALADLCNTYAKQGRSNEAIEIGEKALALMSSLTSEELPFGKEQMLAVCMNNLGCVYETAEKCDDAVRLYQRAFDLKKRTMKENDPSMAAGYTNLAQAYLLQEKYDIALEPAEKAREILDLLGIKNTTLYATTMQNLAEALRGQGRLEEAEKAMNEATELKEKLVAKNDPALADLYLDMAKLSRDKQDYSQSETLFTRSRLIAEKALGVDHPKIGRILREYTKLLLISGRAEEVAPWEERIEAIKAKAS